MSGHYIVQMRQTQSCLVMSSLPVLCRLKVVLAPNLLDKVKHVPRLLAMRQQIPSTHPYTVHGRHQQRQDYFLHAASQDVNHKVEGYLR